MAGQKFPGSFEAGPGPHFVCQKLKQMFSKLLYVTENQNERAIL